MRLAGGSTVARVSQPPFQQRRPPGQGQPGQGQPARPHYDQRPQYAAPPPPYREPGHDPGYDQPGYHEPEYRQPARREPAYREPPQPREPSRGFRLPGLGLLLTLGGLVVQVLSLFVLPWIVTGRGNIDLSASELWQGYVDFGTEGFGGWWVVLFSYPLAALSILLALAAVFESVALKVIWAGLTLIGLGYLVLRFGGGPILNKIGGNATDFDFSPVQITLAIVGLVAIVVVVFLLKTAVSMFRRVAVLILLALTGTHVYAVSDLVSGSNLEDLSPGAFGPALGYLLCAAAAMVPRRLPGL